MVTTSTKTYLNPLNDINILETGEKVNYYLTGAVMASPQDLLGGHRF